MVRVPTILVLFCRKVLSSVVSSDCVCGSIGMRDLFKYLSHSVDTVNCIFVCSLIIIREFFVRYSLSVRRFVCLIWDVLLYI